eukprot:356420-Chlamydomonas_euryale.AAC.4
MPVTLCACSRPLGGEGTALGFPSSHLTRLSPPPSVSHPPHRKKLHLRPLQRMGQHHGAVWTAGWHGDQFQVHPLGPLAGAATSTLFQFEKRLDDEV